MSKAHTSERDVAFQHHQRHTSRLTTFGQVTLQHSIKAPDQQHGSHDLPLHSGFYSINGLHHWPGSPPRILYQKFSHPYSHLLFTSGHGTLGHRDPTAHDTVLMAEKWIGAESQSLQLLMILLRFLAAYGGYPALHAFCGCTTWRMGKNWALLNSQMIV